MVRTLWTIGHSIRPIEDFVALLQSAQIDFVADVRRFPGSRRHPQFNLGALSQVLQAHGINYLSLPELGGRREPRESSTNTAWRNPGFRGYADYMETDEFRSGIERLFEADTGHTAIMCSEGAWTDCHRSLIADYLKARGHRIIHIVSTTKQEEHPYTRAARIVDGQLSYTPPGAQLLI
jgi:uncharacterized protein (DUF488 family)